MKKISYFILFLFGCNMLPTSFYAQKKSLDINVEESAELFLEEFTDDFQEAFFEALKQKGIENYDRAVNLLLKCKQLQPNNTVVDFELAKAYLADEQFIFGQEYAITAVNSEPDNLWYLNTLVILVQKQGNTIDSIKSQLSFSNTKLKENLALIYFKQNKYENALEILRPLNASTFKKELESKIKDSIKKEEKGSQAVDFSSINSSNSDPAQEYRVQIEGLIRIQNIEQLLMISQEALDNYPSQPYFYYAFGYALNKSTKHREAIEVLESGVDYLLNDVSLANKIYTQLADSYTVLNNSIKANMYLSKVKPGF